MASDWVKETLAKARWVYNKVKSVWAPGFNTWESELAKGNTLPPATFGHYRLQWPASPHSKQVPDENLGAGFG